MSVLATIAIVAGAVGAMAGAVAAVVTMIMVLRGSGLVRDIHRTTNATNERLERRGEQLVVSMSEQGAHIPASPEVPHVDS